MMHIIFGEGAEQELLDIENYQESLSPASAQPVLRDIYDAVSILSLFPNAGKKVPGEKFRRIVSTKYKFKIAYLKNDTEIIIVGIVRYQDRDK